MHWHLKRWQSPGISWNNKDFPKPVGNIFKRSMRRIKLHTLSLSSTLKFSTPSNVSRTFSILSWIALSKLFGASTSAMTKSTMHGLFIACQLTVYPCGVAILGNQLQRLLHLKSRRWSLGANQLSGPKSGLGLSLARRHQRNSALLQRLLARVKIKTNRNRKPRMKSLWLKSEQINAST